MGQKIGKPVPVESAAKFLNLPREALESLWASYNLLGEGWGIDCADFNCIVAETPFLTENMGITESDVEALFTALDTDKNGLIDVLEAIVALCVTSGMDTIDKIFFAFSLYDFERQGSLTHNGVTLLLRSVFNGFGKVCEAAEGSVPSEQDLGKIADLVFKDCSKTNEDRITAAEFQHYCCQHPVVSSWLRHMSLVASSAVNSDESVNKVDSDTEEVLSNVSVNRAMTRKKTRVIHTPLSNDVAVDHPWLEFAQQRMLPDEVPPNASRTDMPEDVLDPIWVHGYCASTTKNAVRYGACTGATGANNILIPVGNNIVSMDKNEETQQWQQNRLTKHCYPIVCLETSNSRKLCATADAVDASLATDPAVTCATASIVIWDLKTGEAAASVALTHLTSVRSLDFSADEKLLLIVGNDAAGTIMVLEVPSLRVVFSTSMDLYQDSPGKNTILDARFCNTSSMFCVANGSADGRVDFFVEEDGSFMGQDRLKTFNHYPGLHQKTGSSAVGVPATAMCKFEFADEMIVGNAAGHVMYWRGRSCLQLTAAHDNRAVVAMSYAAAAKVLATAGKDGKINLYSVTPVTFAQKNRQLELVGTIDVTASSKDVMAYSVRSLCLSDDGSKVLVSMKSGEVLELACKNAAVSADAEAEEGATKGVKMGDDIHGAPVYKSHWNRIMSNNAEQEAAVGNTDKTVRITGVCKTPAGFMSCASDGVVRKWAEGEGAPHACVQHLAMDSGCTAIAASRSVAAVTFDGVLNESRKNTIQLINVETMAFVATLSDQEDSVTCLQFAPEGNLLAAGCKDSSIAVYTSSDGTSWSVKGKLAGHTAAVVSVDFSADGQFGRSIDADEKFIVWDLAASFGTEVTSRDVLKTITWGTHNVPVSWDLQNAWNGLKTGEFLTCCDRFNGLFVSGLKSGEISVVRAPNTNFVALPNDLNFRKFFAHNGGVSALCFLDEGTKLVTAGSVDGCIHVWNVSFDVDEFEPDELVVAEGEEAPVDEELPEEDEEELDENGLPKPKFIYYDSGDDEDAVDGQEYVRFIARRKKNHKDGGPVPPSCSSDPEEKQVAAMSAVTNWVDASMAVPVDELLLNAGNTARDISLAPNDELQLTWAHGGYACRSTRSSVRYSRQGKIVYPAGAVGVSFNKVNSAQTHFCGHDSSITAMDVHQATGVAASVQSSVDNVLLCIWDSDSSTILRRIELGAVFGASAVSFSPDGVYVAVACLDFTHTIMVFDWRNDMLHTKVNGGPKKVLCLSFGLPYDPVSAPVAADGEAPPPVVIANVKNTPLRLMHGGIIHFSIVDIKQQGSANVKVGRFGEGVKKSNILSCCALPLPAEGGNEFLLGCSNGTLAVIPQGDKKVASFVPLMERGGITALWVCKVKDTTAEEGPNYQVVAGCTQGHIKVLDMEFAPTSEFNIYAHDMYNLFPIGQVYGIKSLCADKTNRKLLIGTAGGEILEIQKENGEDVNDGPIVQSHFAGQLLALDAHPTRQEAVTVADDKTLRIWDLENNKELNKISIPDIGRCVACAPNGFLIAVGLGAHDLREGRTMPRDNDGKVVIISYMQDVLRIVHETVDAPAPISTVLFSPDNAVLYAGSRARTICIYDALANFTLTRVVEDGIAQPIRSLDISKDGVLLSIQGEDDELILYDLEKRQALPKYDNNIIFGQNEWQARRNTIATDSIGVFPRHGSSKEVTAIARSADNSLFATGDAWGNVNLFQHPCPLPNAPSKSYRAHSDSGGVAQVVFSAEDQYVISIGKRDKVLLQWKLNRGSTKAVDPLPDGALLGKRKMKKTLEFDKPPTAAASEAAAEAGVSDASVDTTNNFDAASFSVSGTCFVKEASSAATEGVALSLVEVHGANQVSGSKAPVAHYIGSGDIISIAGNAPFVVNRQKEKQTIWNIESTNDVGVLAVSYDGRFVYVGERDPRSADVDIFARASKFVGSVRVFDAVSSKEIAVIDSNIFGGVNAICGSPCGRYIAVIGNDDQNSLYIYHSPLGQWQEDATRLFCGQVSVQPQDILSFIFQAAGVKGSSDGCFSLRNTSDAYQLVTGGASYLRFWRLCGNGTQAVAELAEYTTAGSITAEDGTVTTSDGVKLGVVTTGAVSIGAGQVVTSDKTGTLYFWNGKKCTGSIDSAHASAITALIRRGNGSSFLSASADCIKVWNGELPVHIISLGECLTKLGMPAVSDANTAITSLAVDSSMMRMLVGFSGASTAIVEMAVDSESLMLLSEGNTGMDLFMLANPADPNQFVTGSTTGLLKLWNRSSTGNKVVQRHVLDEPITVLRWTQDGSALVVATVPEQGAEDTSKQTGAVLFVSTADDKLTVVNRVGVNNSGPLTAVAFSADGGVMTVATSCATIYVYDREEANKYRHVGRIFLPSIQHGLDFSKDGRFLRTFSQVEYLTDNKGQDLPASAPAEIHFVDLQASGQSEGVVGRELTSEEMLKAMMGSTPWLTTSSCFTPELKGLVDAANEEGTIISSMSISSDSKMVATGYNNGAVRVHK